MKIYHRVPSNLDGSELVPLNELKQQSPALYKHHVQKYATRPAALNRKVLPLNCFWNDVLHFTPIHPEKFMRALNDIGYQVHNLGKWFEFEVTTQAFELSKMALFWSPNQVFGDWSEKAEHYHSIDLESGQQFKNIPDQTINYYKDMFALGKTPLNFFRTPHILYRGRVSVDKANMIFKNANQENTNLGRL
ncbi:hypothetical protein CS022_21625 [Veronia nyctiphanis]|uniref:Uncharacterized protein n=1 Tax=Veronia nyctiphanis TaxID=1278244 RepID=A0A4Q0YME0_9GAMM|nr:hypothetical protein [Veronia nyctiphanis]RXJ71144.1 hypothetical protein CS022_21625 [Veronia nyctiphanis]